MKKQLGATGSLDKLDRRIKDVGIAIQTVTHEMAIVERTMALLDTTADLIEVLMELAQKQQIIQMLIESIQIFSEPMPNGLILERVQFRIPLEYNR